MKKFKIIFTEEARVVSQYEMVVDAESVADVKKQIKGGLDDGCDMTSIFDSDITDGEMIEVIETYEQKLQGIERIDNG